MICVSPQEVKGQNDLYHWYSACVLERVSWTQFFIFQVYFKDVLNGKIFQIDIVILIELIISQCFQVY